MFNLDSFFKRLLQPKKEPQKEEVEPVKMVACPDCGFELPEKDFAAQWAHMDANHPEIIAQRRAALREEIPEFDQGLLDSDLELEDTDTDIVNDDSGEGDVFEEGG